jgi:DNA helicase-2/ATP-dependent DNA helicase PcrA
LRLNYRCGTDIVAASEYALGEARGYQAAEGAVQGTVFFHPRHGTYEQQAAYLFSTVLPAALHRAPDLKLGEIAILYSAAWIGDAVADAASAADFETLRTDGNALYPRSSRLMRWLELCTSWCCGGWRTGVPRLSTVVLEGQQLFFEALVSDEQRLAFQRQLLQVLCKHRESTGNLYSCVRELRYGLITGLVAASRTLDDEAATLNAFLQKIAPTGDLATMTLGLFAGLGDGNERINLSTLHSAKSREFSVVILFGMDNGRVPRFNPSPGDLREARRLFYVGFTRAKSELHIVYTATRPSPFVEEVRARLESGR